MLVENNATAVLQNKVDQRKSNLNQEDFLNMLVTQLRYQDPMDPESGGDMTQQMSMFNMMDQGAKTNEYLAKLLEIQQIDSNQPKMQNMVNYIDKIVEVDTSQITLADGKAECNFSLSAPLDNLQVIISDEYGTDVYSQKLSGLSSGNQKFNWDGRDHHGNYRRSGQYNLSLVGHDQFGNEMKILPKISGVVDTVSKVNGSAYLQVGNMLVDPQKVIAIKKDL